MNKKILVADDDAALLKLYVQFLKKAGFTIIEAQDGEEALSLALAEKPDLIMVDISMPKKDGVTFSKELRTDEWGKNVPLIILTGREVDEIGLEAVMNVEPAYYIMKASESIDTIVTKIEQILSN